MVFCSAFIMAKCQAPAQVTISYLKQLRPIANISRPQEGSSALPMQFLLRCEKILWAIFRDKGIATWKLQCIVDPSTFLLLCDNDWRNVPEYAKKYALQASGRVQDVGPPAASSGSSGSAGPPAASSLKLTDVEGAITKVQTDRSGKTWLEKDPGASGSADGGRAAPVSGSADGGPAAAVGRDGGFPDASSGADDYSYSPYSPSPSPEPSPGPSQWNETMASRSPSRDRGSDVKSEESSGRHTLAAKAAKKEDGAGADASFLAEAYYAKVLQLSEQVAGMISRQDDSDHALRAANEANFKLQRDLQKLSKNVNKGSAGPPAASSVGPPAASSSGLSREELAVQDFEQERQWTRRQAVLAGNLSEALSNGDYATCTNI